jgi:hypothetical protein
VTVMYAILPNVRHDCDLTRLGGFGHLVRPARFTTCNDNALATSYVLHDLVETLELRHHVMALSRHQSSTCLDAVIWNARTRRGQKDCKASLVGQHANPRLCTANASNRSLSSPPNCRRICKPSERPLGLKPASQVRQTT